MNKQRLSYEEQATLLSKRGLVIDDVEDAVQFLSQVNYYRFSGYFRYWQRDPTHGDNQFIDGASFNVIRDLYLAEQNLVIACDDLLHPIEVLLRTRFAYHYAERVGSCGKFVLGEGFTHPPKSIARPIEHYLLTNLNRSQETFIAHYREDIKEEGRYTPEAYEHMPVWVAVEAFSFGNLSRVIQASRR
uniref:Abi family protein n=1 Tax=Stomatohabitans albus TaxID=3110766 RepID=UPI00300D5C68